MAKTKYVFDTKYGKIALYNDMIEVDGIMEDGVVLELDGKYVNDMTGFEITINEKTTVDDAIELYEFLRVD